MPESRNSPKVTLDIEAQDLLGVLVRRVTLENEIKGDLRKQAHSVVERITYLGGELRVLEVDGIANAVQIRTRKPQDGRYVEILLRNGNFLSLEAKPSALNLSKADFDRLIEDLIAVF